MCENALLADHVVEDTALRSPMSEGEQVTSLSATIVIFRRTKYSSPLTVSLYDSADHFEQGICSGAHSVVVCRRVVG